MAQSTFADVNRPPTSLSVMEATKKSIKASIGKGNVCKRAQLIHTGTELMYRKGYHGTSIKDITTATGIPKGSFYNYFASKEEFTIEALEYFISGRVEELTSNLQDQVLSPVRRISAIFRNNPDRFSTREFTPMSFMNKISTELKISHPVIAEIVINFFNRCRDSLADCLREAQRHGEISKDKDPFVLANFILYAWHGVLLHAGDSDNRDTIDEFCNILERDLLV